MIAFLPSWGFPRGPEVWWIFLSGALYTGVNIWKTRVVDYQAKLNCVHQRQANLSHKTCEAGCFQGLLDQRHLKEIIYINQKVFLNLVEREASVHQGNVPQAVHSICQQLSFNDGQLVGRQVEAFHRTSCRGNTLEQLVDLDGCKASVDKAQPSLLCGLWNVNI